jgi:cytochrome c
MPERHRPILSAILMLLAVMWLAGCGTGDDDQAALVEPSELLSISVPAEFQSGEALFERHCASCHGEKALGSAVGPPLVHIVYEPSHHADYAFYMAVGQGVRAHHWRFGDMPPVPGLDQDEVTQIIAYVRWLQRQVGIR